MKKSNSFLAVPLLGIALSNLAPGSDFVVAAAGGDFSSIQAALNTVHAGDRILVRERAGGWNERLHFTSSGSASAGFVELLNFPGESPIVDATGLPGQRMLTIANRSYVRVSGLEFRNNVANGDGSGIRVTGAGSHIEILDCVFHDLTGNDSMAITVYGTSTTAAIEDLLIRGNEIYDCTPAQSEALTLNGNVRRFIVEDNLVRDVNNIGIDFIAGESSINPSFGAREGICRRNVVLRARSSYGGGFGAGIYVDGASDIVIEQNLVVGSDLGIEIGAENAGWDATNVVCRNNVLAGNEKAGLVFGGYDASVGRARNCQFLHNLIWKNFTINGGVGDVWIQYAENCELRGNVIVAGPSVASHGDIALTLDNPFPGAMIEGNLWYGDSGAPAFEWNGAYYGTFAAFQAGTGLGAGGQFADPLLIDPEGADGILGTSDDQYGLSPNSPGIDAGDAAAWLAAFPDDAQALVDFMGGDRLVDSPAVVDLNQSPLGTQPDLGPIEYVPATGAVSRYCTPIPTSYVQRGRMAISGSTSVSAGTLTLRGLQLPPSGFGLFFYAPHRAAFPAGDGVVCLGGTAFRLPPTPSSAAGTTALPLDVAQIAGAGAIHSGETWSFQHWFRDPIGGPAGFNFTDALTLQFVP